MSISLSAVETGISIVASCALIRAFIAFREIIIAIVSWFALSTSHLIKFRVKMTKKAIFIVAFNAEKKMILGLHNSMSDWAIYLLTILRWLSTRNILGN